MCIHHFVLLFNWTQLKVGLKGSGRFNFVFWNRLKQNIFKINIEIVMLHGILENIQVIARYFLQNLLKINTLHYGFYLRQIGHIYWNDRVSFAILDKFE